MCAMDARYIAASVAARRLGVSPTTIRNWLRDGRLQGSWGPQPSRPRCYVLTAEDGRPLDGDGRPIASVHGSTRMPEGFASEVAGRAAALQLSAVLETHRQAFGLVLQALTLMDRALAEQGQIIAGLLVDDPAHFAHSQS